jgi:hypothetical protein
MSRAQSGTPQGFIFDVALKDAIEERTFPGSHLVPAAHAITVRNSREYLLGWLGGWDSKTG